MQKILTIVVPVYKVEAYINKCLDSLLLPSDTMERLEVLIVNDGTPDNSAEMSREYVKRYPGTFRQIDKENGGHGSAWNVGLREATGKYLRFLDSDDWFENLDSLLIRLSDCDVDLVFNPYIKQFVFSNSSEIVEPPIPPGKETLIDNSFWGTSRWGLNNVNFWGVTYKTEILKPLQPLFAEKAMFDDYILTWAPLVYGRTCLALDFLVYNYLLGRPEQSMSARQQRIGAISYAKCFDHYEEVRSRLDISRIPTSLVDGIDSAFSAYASDIFSYMVYLPMKEARRRMNHLWKEFIIHRDSKSKLQVRYRIVPFPVFYLLEHIRRRIKK